MNEPVSSDVALLTNIYAAFNARDIEAVLTEMHPDVDWPNAMEGSRVLGRDAVRQYWTAQFRAIDPSVEPLGFTLRDDGRIAVEVHQVVRDLSGSALADTIVYHVYRIEDGLIRSMEIL